MTVSKQHPSSRLTTFRDFMKHRSTKEEAVVIATSGASLIRLDGDQSAEERQSTIDEFGVDCVTPLEFDSR